MHENTTRSAGKYKQLTIEEREEIAIGLERGDTLSSIAGNLGRHRSTVSRELNRNLPSIRRVCYRANCAQKRSDVRNKASRSRERLKTAQIRQYVEDKLRAAWTPEQIAGRLPKDEPAFSTNYESIYQWIYIQRRDLIAFLPRSHRKRRKRGSAKNKKCVRVPNRVMIDQRPSKIDARTEPGHWEADTAVSRQSKAAIAVVYERTSRYCKLTRMASKSAENMQSAVIGSLKTVPPKIRKSITYDNGTENAYHEAINETLKTTSYFCRPYHSWEKGGVENSIGLIRRFYPKKTDWGLLMQNDLDIIEHWLNTRPRKCLGFRTAQEVFVALTR
jgi:IS30 family transposase